MRKLKEWFLSKLSQESIDELDNKGFVAIAIDFIAVTAFLAVCYSSLFLLDVYFTVQN